MNGFEILSLCCNILSLLILFYQLYASIVNDCKTSKHELTEEQQIFQILEIVKEINHDRRSSN